MSAPDSKQWREALSDVGKHGVRTQIAALCYRIEKTKPRILLITSRGTRQWILPKGWIIAGEQPAQTAVTEAWEEAGARGTLLTRPVGLFASIKEMDRAQDLPCVVVVYALRVASVSRRYPERSERKRKWVSRRKGASMVQNPELAKILREFDPADLR